MTKQFNKNIRLILADVDETIADVYTKATPEMIEELSFLLREGKVLFLVSGGGLQSIQERITDMIAPELRHRIIIAHCSGAEVWGFAKNGQLEVKPYYGVYDSCMNDEQKKLWRSIIAETIELFGLKTYDTQPRASFVAASGADPQSVMLADRGPQITFECTNSIDLTEEQKNKIEAKTHLPFPLVHDAYDLRVPMQQYLQRRYAETQLPVQPKFGGIFALDNILGGVDKTKAILYVLDHESILQKLDIHKADINESQEIEIWGDKFAQKKSGPDFQMCLAVSPNVRAIDFRAEEVVDLPTGYNIQLWDGQHYLHEGLLEYLQSREHIHEA